jgi:hypothetical protein
MKAPCTVAIARAACLRRAPELRRVWCPELSGLDAEVDGERRLWQVQARPGNDTTPITAATQIAGSSAELLGNVVIDAPRKIARATRQGRGTLADLAARAPRVGGAMTRTEIRELVEQAHAGLERVDTAIAAACAERVLLRQAFSKLQRAAAALAEDEETSG